MGRRKAYLVDHHHSQQVADSSKEQAIEVVVNRLTDPRAEGVENDLADDEEHRGGSEIPQRPAVLQSVHHEDDLHDEVDEQTDGVDDVQHNKQARGIRRRQSRPALKREQRDDKRQRKHRHTGEPQQPNRQKRAVFI